MSKINTIEIENFRSIKSLYLEPENLTALIGPNSSGKTNILKAIDLVLGEGWTTKAKVARELFRDPNKKIEIKIAFSSPIAIPSDNPQYPKETLVNSIELNLSLLPELTAKTTFNGGETSYGLEKFKKLCQFVYLPSERNLSNELRVSNWTMLGKMMKLIYENYIAHYDGNEEQLKLEFKNKISNAKSFLEDDFSEEMVTFYKFNETFKKFCEINSSGLANSFEPKLNIYNLNWFYKTLQIHVEEDYPGKTFDSEEVGAGMQNLLMISIFQTYSELMGGKVIFGIEEPELYLYPQAQRHLFKNLQEISMTSQIFYATHNPNFVDALRAYDIFPLRKNSEKGTYLLNKNSEYLTISNAEKSKYKIYTHFNTERNEIFFANKILLVEGDSDKILFTTLAEETWNLNLDKESISIIECGGKSGVIYFIGICRLLGIENFFAIWDADEDKNDSLDHLKYAKNEGKGYEIVKNLEDFLGIDSTIKDKVQAAHEWALSIDKNNIPEDFDKIRVFLINQDSFSPSNDSELIEPDDLPF